MKTVNPSGRVLDAYPEERTCTIPCLLTSPGHLLDQSSMRFHCFSGAQHDRRRSVARLSFRCVSYPSLAASKVKRSF
jgi:hypothetical protein